MIPSGPSFWTGAVAPWWATPLVTLLGFLINAAAVVARGMISHREHKKTSADVQKNSDKLDTLLNGNGRDR